MAENDYDLLGAILNELRELNHKLAFQLAFHRNMHGSWIRASVSGTASAIPLYTNRTSRPVAVSVLASDVGDAGMATVFTLSSTSQQGSPTNLWRFHDEDRRLNLILMPGEAIYNAGGDGSATIYIGVSSPFDPRRT